MGRILAIDYGLKRSGLAVSDPLQIIANGLDTISSPELITFLKGYFQKETVDLILIGMPKDLSLRDTHGTKPVKQIIEKIKSNFPDKLILELDERFTSKMASRTMVDMGLKKKDRQNKSNIDKIAATILLQEYLSSVK
jgi:putative Holliday junction resolvase